MMTKKKSNRWARLKFLLLLPVAALFVYACAQPEVNRQLEQAIRSEDTTISSSNQHFTPIFFEAELNKYISELGGSTSLTTAEKYNFLAEKTNVVNPNNYREQACNAGKFAETPLVSIAFAGNTGKGPRTFNIRKDDVIGYSLDLESSSVIELEEWIKSLKRRDFQYYTVSIRASGETPMGVITDLKQLLRNAYLLKISYREIN